MITTINNNHYYAGMPVHSLRQENNHRQKHYYFVISHNTILGRIALTDEDVVKYASIIEKQKQSNYYNVIDSMGRPTKIYIVASNIKEAYAEAKKRQAEIGSAYYKLKRSYNGGVRG